MMTPSILVTGWASTLEHAVVSVAFLCHPFPITYAMKIMQPFERFVQAMPQINQRTGGRALTHADLRYPNGFAITLAALPEPTQPKKKR